MISSREILLDSSSKPPRYLPPTHLEHRWKKTLVHPVLTATIVIANIATSRMVIDQLALPPCELRHILLRQEFGLIQVQNSLRLPQSGTSI